MFAPPQNSYAEILTTYVMALIPEAFGKGLSHEDEALMNGKSALKKIHERSSFPSLCSLPGEQDTARRQTAASQEENCHLNLTMPAPRSHTSNLQNGEQ